MITNFEEITIDLSDAEKNALPIVCKYFSLLKTPTKSPDIIKYLSTSITDVKITDVRLRKYVNYIRSKHILPIIGTSNGYFVSYDNEVIQKQILSLHERANSILQSGHGLVHFLNLPVHKEGKQSTLFQ